jgi:hypothetical protein
MVELYFNIKGTIDYFNSVIGIITNMADIYDCCISSAKSDNEGGKVLIKGERNQLVDVQSALKKMNLPEGNII